MIVEVTNYSATQSVKLYYPDGPVLEHKKSVVLDFDDLTDSQVTDVMQICWENVCGYKVLERDPPHDRIWFLLNT